MGMSKRKKLTWIAMHLKGSSSWSMREKTRQEIRDLRGDEDDRRHKTLSHATLQQQERQQAEQSPHPAFVHPVTLPCPLFRRATL
jgi:hypothetical protein